VSRGIVVQEQDPLGDLPSALFLQNVPQLSFGALSCRKKKLDDSSRLDVVEIARVA